MNLVKSKDYFNPISVKSRCHIIGCGSVGSSVAELLARLGVEKISLYDFDIVEPHNIVNQMFVNTDIKREKVYATKDIIMGINPAAENHIKVFDKGYSGERLSGYVFLCVDNIDLRRQICESNIQNKSIKAVFDFRTRLEDAQHYAADWSMPDDIKNLISTMQFTHEEAHEATPVTACNVEMGVAPTVRLICGCGIANFMNFVRLGVLKKMLIFNIFDFDLLAI